jgi:hypothetical protein
MGGTAVAQVNDGRTTMKLERKDYRRGMIIHGAACPADFVDGIAKAAPAVKPLSIAQMKEIGEYLRLARLQLLDYQHQRRWKKIEQDALEGLL